MADFDPDAFLKNAKPETKSSQPGGFDPDAFLSSSPKLYTKREEPDVSAGQVLGAIGRGTAEGVLGAPGGIESFATQTIPKLFGGEGAESTILPTSSDIEQYVQKSEEKLGMNSGLDPRLEPYRQGGALFGENVAPVGFVGGLAAKAIKPLKETAKGKGLEEALGTVTTSIQDLAKQASSRINAKESEAVNELIKRSGQRRVNLTDAEKKLASEIQSTRETDAARFADLGQPSSTARLGDEMQRRLTGTEFSRKARASQTADSDVAKYYQQASQKDWGTSPEFADVMMNLREMATSGKFNPDERKLAVQMYQDLKTTKDIEGVEKVFRKYNEASKGLPKEGYDSVMQIFSGNISDMLSKALNNFAPARKEFRGTYEEMMRTLDEYKTSFGSKGVAKEKVVPDRTQMMPTDYPGYYFQNRDTVRVLLEQLAGDAAAVRKFANQHVVNELQGKNAKQATEWLNKNKEWVDDVPGLNNRVNRYVNNLNQSEAKVGTLDEQINALKSKREKVGKVSELSREKVTTKSAEQQEFINKSLVEFNKTIPSEIPNKANDIVSDLWRKNVISKQEYEKYIDQINNAKIASKTKEEAARKIRQIIGGAVTSSAVIIGGPVAYGLRRTLGY